MRDNLPRAKNKRNLFRCTLAARMEASAINVGGFFHGLALGTAVFARCYFARADGVRTLPFIVE
jgi:hypothetical protein